MTQPLTTIPEAWAAKGRCPLCSAAPLMICREAAPDRMVCARCGAAFEVEAGGPNIRLVRLPAMIPAAPDGAWRSAAEARDWVRTLAPPRAPAPAGAESQAGPESALPLQPVEPESRAPAEPAPQPTAPERQPEIPGEALARAQELFALRHSLPQIQAILERAGEWTPEQVLTVMAELARLEAQARARQDRTLRLVLGGSLSLLLVIFVAVALMLARPRATPQAVAPQSGGASGAPALTPTPASLVDAFAQLFAPDTAGPSRPGAAPSGAPSISGSDDLPAALQTLVPPGARLVNPTPIVRQGDTSSAPSASACPRSPEDAAQLFGGDANDWHYDDQSGGWMLLSALNTVTVQVPANMTAGYLTFGQNLSISEVSGPATIENVNMVAIVCP